MKKLYRSSSNKLLGGVLAGFAEYYDHDPVLWRLGFIALLAITGFMPFTLIYLIAWVVMPPRPVLTSTDHTAEDEQQRA